MKNIQTVSPNKKRNLVLSIVALAVIVAIFFYLDANKA